jgi:BA14K-like protein
MFSKTAAVLQAIGLKSDAGTLGRQAGVFVRSSVLAVACVAMAGPASARSNTFDGDWSVVIMTTGGACQPSLRYGVEISNGNVLNAGNAPVTVQGRVAPNGGVKVSVQSGGQWANGFGRLGMTSGRGVWQGQGSSGACQGTWAAERRTNAAQAEMPGRPIYNYSPGAVAPRLGPEVTSCRLRFHSYDPRTGTYLGIDGLRHPCR